ncbi:hypothetical protein CFN78_19745 [Amycolatopsis antarctica]|uniref:Uncharacterized protein n=1 Tax=Amycolatopsis antarctica TaxID=1854586 RepID=A0A263CZK5_9PSEU|nr:hypothetical protein CFN78_19745 [Amycolatopsis antarctica]
MTHQPNTRNRSPGEDQNKTRRKARAGRHDAAPAEEGTLSERVAPDLSGNGTAAEQDDENVPCGTVAGDRPREPTRGATVPHGAPKACPKPDTPPPKPHRWPDAPRKQRPTATRILARLVDERSATNQSYSTVRDYMRVRRADMLHNRPSDLCQRWPARTNSPSRQARPPESPKSACRVPAPTAEVPA